MRSGTFAFTLLSLFTTEQRAAEIEGDLIEEGAYRGRSWFTIHVIGTALALFKESYRQAPLRITALGLAATCIAAFTCGVIARVFSAPDAFYPEPLLGFLAIPVSAFLTGFGLGYLGSGLGVRAAAFTTIVLTILFVVARISSGTSDGVFDLDAGLALALLTAIVSTLGQFAMSIVIYLAPLMAGSVYGNNRLN
jgi:hypothetical protein